MVREEALLFLMLKRAGKKALLSPLETVRKAETIGTVVTDLVLASRARVASKSLEVTRELLLGLEVSPGAAGSTVRAARARAELSAARAGHGIANRFLSAELSADSAVFDLAGEASRVAASEVVDAYSFVRSETIDRLSETAQRALIKIWQTVGDQRVCSRCLSHEGETIPANEYFPDGEAPLHPKCRCSYSIDLRP
jgi:hypothetical protein